MKFWMIADITQAAELPPRHPARFKGDGILQREHAPRVIYESKARAEDELIRLQRAHPALKFVLLESMAMCEHYLIPRQIFQVVRIAGDDERR